MSGETCPRCRYKEGYPNPVTISRAKKMVFVCRNCDHRWIKRKTSHGFLANWYLYGIGLFVGIVYGLYELSKRLFTDLNIHGIIEKAKEFFASLINMLRGIF